MLRTFKLKSSRIWYNFSRIHLEIQYSMGLILRAVLRLPSFVNVMRHAALVKNEVCCNPFTETVLSCMGSMSLLSGRNLSFKSPRELRSEYYGSGNIALYQCLRRQCGWLGCVSPGGWSESRPVWWNSRSRYSLQPPGDTQPSHPHCLRRHWYRASPRNCEIGFLHLQQASGDEQAGMIMARCSASAFQVVGFQAASASFVSRPACLWLPSLPLSPSFGASASLSCSSNIFLHTFAPCVSAFCSGLWAALVLSLHVPRS